MCNGRRLRDDGLAVRIQNRSIMDVCDMSIDECYHFSNARNSTETERYIARTILKEIMSRLDFLLNVGLNYLTLNGMIAHAFRWRVPKN